MRAARRLLAPLKAEFSAEPALTVDDAEAPLSRTDSAAAWQKAEVGGIASTSVTVVPSRTSRLMSRFLPRWVQSLGRSTLGVNSQNDSGGETGTGRMVSLTPPDLLFGDPDP